MKAYLVQSLSWRLTSSSRPDSQPASYQVGGFFYHLLCDLKVEATCLARKYRRYQSITMVSVCCSVTSTSIACEARETVEGGNGQDPGNYLERAFITEVTGGLEAGSDLLDPLVSSDLCSRMKSSQCHPRTLRSISCPSQYWHHPPPGLVRLRLDWSSSTVGTGIKECTLWTCLAKCRARTQTRITFVVRLTSLLYLQQCYNYYFEYNFLYTQISVHSPVWW